MYFAKRNDGKRFLVGISMLLLLTLVGCMSLRNAERQQTSVPLVKSQFEGKTIAILPVKEGKIQSSMATESTRNLRIAINEAIDNKVAKLIPTAKIINNKTSATNLNDSDKLNLLENLFQAYEVTGTFDKKTIESLCDCLHADYIVVSQLKVAKMDASILGKGVNATMDAAIVGMQTKDVVWGGSASFKKAGTMGFGGSDDKDVAAELVNLVFSTY